MAVSHGMNIDEIEAFGNRLQNHFAAELNSIANELETIVGQTSSSWVGPDGEKFRSWWPAKRSAIRATADDVHGFGQSALNNASEQREASGDRAGTSSGDTRAWIPVPSVPGTPDGPPFEGAVVLPGSGRSADEVAKAYADNWTKYGLYRGGAPGGPDDYECVAWAWFRLRELGYEGPQMSANGIGVATTLGGHVSTVPEPGAVMSWGYERGAHEGWEYGHVAIAESVTTNAEGALEVRVSEMNVWDGEGVGKYRDSKVFVQQADGSWRDSMTGAIRSITVANPEFGTPKI